MEPGDVIPTNAFKAQLAAHIRDVRQTPGRRVYVGARRVPEAVLMSVGSDVPSQLRAQMIGGLIRAEGRTFADECNASGTIETHIGDPLGSLFAWLAQSTSPATIATRFEQLRKEINKHLSIAPSITAAQLWRAFEPAWPGGSTPPQLVDLVASAADGADQRTVAAPQRRR
ncbi:hypothetical protein ACORG1_34020 (plasmid) [Mycobacterium sp. TJFP1]|uniref:hypothetical protein n=1 Tax=Mycobacterium sp. MS1601 TaxID=1936029 RepID=UPI0009797172|nr:hypothetical protein [Mycobacterium sp. MS1601]AQA06928.1 hypothetical protein BVC93_30970 [Mycobacterium sp. MS1601]